MIYLAVERPRVAEELQALSSRLMRWKDDVWLVDLSVTYSYWQAQAARRGTDVLSLMRELLPKLTTEDGVAAVSEHPFRALLLARHLSSRRLRGLAHGDDGMGLGLWRDLGWLTFWQVAEELLPHFSQVADKRGNRPTFRQKLGLMQRSMRRLGVKAPWQLSEMEPLALKRRFGPLMGDLWQWLFGDGAPGDDKGRVGDFPWHSHAWQPPPAVQRSLDFGVGEWQALEPWLREDLDRLCALPTWSSRERVLALDWRLVFDDLSERRLTVRFRHPHGLHKELGKHVTALKQFLYVYEDDARGRDESILQPPLTAWELTLSERLTPPPLCLGLFGEYDAGDEALASLENKLPVPLAAYASRSDWLPEDSFAESHHITVADGLSLAQPSLSALARARPLFLYQEPRDFDGNVTPEAYTWEFLERTMSKWWRGLGLQRDYYRVTDRQQRSYWVFRDSTGRWLIHGVFA